MIGTFSTNNTIGDRVLSLGVNPTKVKFKVAQKNSTTEPFIHYSDGVSDGTSQLVDSLFWDGAGESRTYTDRCINHIVRESGALVNKVVATLKSINGDGSITVNFSATVTGYRVIVDTD